jgi:hypothetical protein
MPRMWTTVSKQTRMKMHKIMTYFVHHNVIQSREKLVKGFLIQANGSIVMESYEVIQISHQSENQNFISKRYTNFSLSHLFEFSLAISFQNPKPFL